MTISEVSADVAKSNLRRNKSSMWPDARRNAGRLGVYTNCALKPDFTFTIDDKVFTTGSCFARNIERLLADLGFSLPTLEIQMPVEERVGNTANGNLNKYVTRSVLNELRWGLGVEPFPELTLLKVGDDRWHDPHLHSDVPPVTWARAIERRRQIDAMVKSLGTCRVFIMTLGLVEAWVDRKADCWLNGMPPAAAIAVEPERFALVRQSYADILSDLHEIHRLLQEHGHPDVKVLITVSPVPFRATYADQDAIVANCYSKSVLRAAAEEFVQAYENVNYFPSYEMVTLSDRAVAYMPDNIHVQSAMVQRVMAQVLRAYAPTVITTERAEENVSSFGTTPAELLKSAQAAEDRGDFLLSGRLLQRLTSNFGKGEVGLEAGILDFRIGAAFVRAGRRAEALSYLRGAYKARPADAALNFKIGQILYKIRHEEAGAFLGRACELDPTNARYSWFAGQDASRRGDLARARRHYERCLEIAPGHVEASAALSDMREAI